MNFWFNHGNNCLSITFDKELVKYAFKKYTKKNVVKHIDSIYQKSISIFGIVFTYGNFNYNDIVYVMIDHKNDNFTNSENHHAISVLKETLFDNVKKNHYHLSTTPFNWNYLFDTTNGNVTYFITGKKKWFDDNNLSELYKYNEIDNNRKNIIDNLHRFPKYNISKTTNPIEFIKD